MALETQAAGSSTNGHTNGSSQREPTSVDIGLTAAIVSVASPDPVVLVTSPQEADRSDQMALPSGTFSPQRHTTLEAGLRNSVTELTTLQLGHVEQLDTVSDRWLAGGSHVVSIGYLAFARTDSGMAQKRGSWRSWYDFLPWEDWRKGKPKILNELIEPQLRAFTEQIGSGADRSNGLQDQMGAYFGLTGGPWDEEKVLERYDVLYQAGLLAEARRDQPTGRDTANGRGHRRDLGRPMIAQHRRILATAVGRLRTRLKSRPVVFELMPDEFTLFELQRTVEAILGPHLHKQNFRRLVESGGLVAPTGEVRSKTGGRPARLYRFRHEVIRERSAPGVRVNTSRAQTSALSAT